MGNGTFNLMISLLPARVIKLLEFIGFSGNKLSGLQDLENGAKMSGLRQVLCVMTLLGYHLIVCYVLSHQEGDLDFCNEVLEKQLSVRHKSGLISLAGRANSFFFSSLGRSTRTASGFCSSKVVWSS